MKLPIFALSIVITATPAFANPCHDRFAELLVPGNQKTGPTRLHITQEIVGGQTSLNYHYSDGKGNGMTEMIDPADQPMSLFLDDNMYSSTDKGKSWSFMNSYDAKKSLADMKKNLTNDAAKATGVLCGREEYKGALHEVVEGNYKSTMVSGSQIYQKYWINEQTGLMVKSYSHLKGNGFESKTTQVIEPYPELKLPNPE